MTSERILVVTRHAHRDTFDKSLDNGLSERGKIQAKGLADLYRKRFAEKPALLLSSPKKRCIETLGPISQMLGVEIEIDPLLDEEGGHIFEEYRKRILSFYENWLHRTDPLTHGDWIPDFFEIALRQRVSLEKGGWMEIIRDDQGIRLK